ncbi:MAG: hypothetical protein IJ299_04830 [Oscillospiraceae bacterium]|nr:hypothetical protein [Oscillospiraceae bacterium]
MASCKDCLHYEACKSLLEAQGYVVEGDGGDADNRCPCFADKTLYVKLPFKPGELVYMPGHKFPSEIEEITFNLIDGITYNWAEYDKSPELTEVWDDGWFVDSDIGQTVFLSREEAEAALKERENDG